VVLGEPDVAVAEVVGQLRLRQHQVKDVVMGESGKLTRVEQQSELHDAPPSAFMGTGQASSRAHVDDELAV
jgi:hypothetical protein